jgi:putative endonuclease
MANYVYIIQSLQDGTYYVGSTQALRKRLDRHNQGRSKYTKNKRPWKLVYSEEQLVPSISISIFLTLSNQRPPAERWGYEDGPSKGPGPRSAGGR